MSAIQDYQYLIRRTMSAICCIAVAGPVFAQEANNNKQPTLDLGTQNDATSETNVSAEGGPKISFSELTHDFGEVWVGTALEHTFEVKNDGKKPLELTNVKPSCGCTVAKDYDKIIEPGTSGKIPVTLKSDRLNGKFTKTIRVTSNDVSQRNVTLKVTGNVKHYIVAEPRFVNFGKLSSKEEKSMTIKLTNNSEKPIELSVDKPNVGKSFTAELKEVDAGQTYELTIHSKPPYREGRQSAVVKIKTNLTEQPTLDIRASADVQPRLAVRPDKVIIAKASPSATQRKLRVSNNGTSMVQLLEATVDDDKLSISTKVLEEGKQFEVVIDIPEGYVPARTGKTLTLKLDDPEKPEIKVPVRSTVRPPRPAELLAGKEAPEVEFVTNSGQAFSTKTKTNDVTILKFYATWCPHCKRAMPEMEKLHQEYKDKGVRMIAVNMDDPDNPNKRKAFTKDASLERFKTFGATFDIAFDADHERKISGQFKVSSFPTTFILDKSGKIAHVHVGGFRPDNLKTFKEQIDVALNGPTSVSQNTEDNNSVASGTK